MLNEEEKALLRQGKYLETIKTYRTRTGAGLYEAKMLVDEERVALSPKIRFYLAERQAGDTHPQVGEVLAVQPASEIGRALLAALQKAKETKDPAARLIVRVEE